MDYQKNKSSHHLHKQSPREVCAHPSPKIKTCRRNFSKLLNIIGMVHQNLLNDVRAVHACEVWSIHVNSVVYGTTMNCFFLNLRGFKTWLFQYILGWSFLYRFLKFFSMVEVYTVSQSRFFLQKSYRPFDIVVCCVWDSSNWWVIPPSFTHDDCGTHEMPNLACKKTHTHTLHFQRS